MLTRMNDWLEHRSGVRKFLAVMLLEGIPGGARWRYVWGSALVFVFSIQLITGVLLMTAYSPSSTQAWSSVHFIQYQMDFGWFIRGLHHFGSQTMMVLIGLHMLQVVIAGAHLPPREINWWLGMGLFGVVFGLSLTGYLLPWDQKGFWATQVATNIANGLPVVGPFLRQLMVGGEDYGNHTLTRFYGLHVAILPGTMIVLLIMHITIFRRQGVTCKANAEGLISKPENEHAPGSETFWPRQAFYDLVASLLIFGVMLGLLFYGHGHPVETPDPQPVWTDYDYWARAGQRGLGANLDAAADRETSDYPARPEWYFLFLFQLLKYFEGPDFLIGAVFIPNGVVVLLLLLPLFGYGPMRKVGHILGILVVVTLLILVAALTAKALDEDQPTGILWGVLKDKNDKKAVDVATEYQKNAEKAEAKAQRACQLAMDGTPTEGGHVLLRNDPLTRGRELFNERCGTCHNFTKRGKDPFPSWEKGPSASDLGDFASADWIRGLLTDSMTPKYFGLVKDKEKKDEPGLTGMRGWRKGIDAKRADWDKEKIAAQEKDFDLIAQWLADQAKPKDKRDKELAKTGHAAFNAKQNKCAGCHTIDKEGGGENAPDLTRYGSAEWIRGMIMRPGHASRYGEKNQMSAFRNQDGAGSELSMQEFRESNPNTKDSEIQNLSDIQRELIIRFMLRDYRPVFGGAPIN